MDNWVAWAFRQQLGTGEKLVLVYLASLAGAAGVGLLHREALAGATDYEPRSLQRILKNLRDAGLLRTEGDWFAIGATPGNEAGAKPPADLAAYERADARPLPLITEAELEVAGETLGKAITEAGDALLVRFNDASLRLLRGIERIAIASAQLMPPEDPPPPDPVRESVHFKAFMTSGFLSEEEAYALAEKRLKAEQDATGGGGHAVSVRRTQDTDGPEADAGPDPDPGAPTRSYADNPLGRFERIRDILEPGAGNTSALLAVWQRLEEGENKYTVEGETDAFELLYPAIVVAARAQAGKMTLAQFLDEKAIRAGRAPWEVFAAPSNEGQLQLEISQMLTEIEQANHPMAQVGPRTVEKEGGRTLTESTAAYHARVKRVYQQLKKLQTMGV